MVRRIRIDADPKLVNAMGLGAVTKWCNTKGIVLEGGPGLRHESVAHAEQRIDTTTRMSLEALARAKRGRAYKIKLKAYASQVLNYRCRRGEDKTRYETHIGEGPPDFTKLAPPLLA